MSVFVPADLFALANVGDPWPRGLAKARRLLVTLCVVRGGLVGGAKQADSDAARRAWEPDCLALTRWATVTVMSVLLQLKQLGVIVDITNVDGGYEVELTKDKEVAA